MIAAALYVLLMGIDFDPSFSTLSVLTRLRDEYGLKREETDEMIHVFRVARATGELGEFDAMIEAKLTASQLKKLRAHSFQCALGTGALKRALLENRVELNDKQLEQIAIDTLAARKLALSHYAEDRSSISTWTLEPLIVPKRLLALQGDRFEFKTQSRPHEGMTSSCVDTIPLEILLWPEVQTELRLKLSQLNGVRRLRHRYVELGTVIEEFWEPMESGKPDEDSEALYEEVKSLLHDDQVQRFNQILLQRYVASFPPYAARHLRRMGEKIPIGNKEFSARMSSYSINTFAVRHYRRLHHFAECAEDYMEKQKVWSLMTPHFLPKRLGKSPVLEAEVFKQLTRSKRETTREAIERRRSGE